MQGFIFWGGGGGGNAPLPLGIRLTLFFLKVVMKHYRCITLGVQCCIALVRSRSLVRRAVAGLGCYMGVASSDREKMTDHVVKQMKIVIS